MAIYQKAKEDIATAVEMLDANSLIARRDIEIKYHRLTLTVNVKDAYEEGQLRLAAVVKAAALQSGMEHLVGEAIDRSTKMPKVEAAVFEQWDVARKACMDFVKSAECDAGEFLLEVATWVLCFGGLWICWLGREVGFLLGAS